MFFQQDIPAWYHLFLQGKSIVIDNLDLFETSMPKECRRHRIYGNSTVIAFPILCGSQCLGYVRIDNPDLSRCDRLIQSLILIGNLMGSIYENNRKNTILKQRQISLSQNQSELEQERLFLDVLCRDYTSVFFVDLEKDLAEPLKVDRTANAAKLGEMTNRSRHSFSSLVQKYSETYVISSQTSAFQKFLSVENLTRRLKHRERISFRYTSVPNRMDHQYFEAQAIRISDHEFDRKVLIGFHHIDDLIASEQQRQQALEQALGEAQMSNEVLSALGKIYYAIFRIDLINDWYEEISSDSAVHHLTGKNGCASTELIELCNTFVVPEYHDRILQFFDISTLAERLHDEETIATEYLATDGNWHTARFIAKRRNSQGEVTHVLYVTRLISDAKRREQNWIAIAREDNKANAAKTEFISQIAHDIRTPMNAIMGFATITEAHVEDPEQVSYGLKKIKTAGNFLLDLVNEVLDISKIENGQMNLQPQNVNIQELLQELPAAVEHAQANKELHIHYWQHQMLHDWVKVDPLRLKQIYVNILSNAVKYTPDGGTVDFDIFEEELRGTQKVRLVATSKDTGIGMTPEYMKQMYSKFTRATDTRINKVNGSGLGLSIVKQLVDLMEGSIEVNSVPGKGTTFRVILDLPYVEESGSKNSPVDCPDYNTVCKGMHLLVAEDNDLNFEVISELLSLHGITCEHAEDGSVCLEKFQEHAPYTYDAILMDMQMPIMDGLQTTVAIRTLNRPDAHQILLVIILTAESISKLLAISTSLA